MSALAPVDAASCRAMAVECGRRANELVAIRQYELARARDLVLLAVWFEQNPVSARGLKSNAESAGGIIPPPVVSPAANYESDGPKSRLGDAAASLTQQSNSPRQERPSAQERSSDRSGGQFGDAPKPATHPHSLQPPQA